MIAGIVATSSGGGIGYQNRMPWPFLIEDMKWFKSLTTNNVVIMGSNTWFSLPKKLPNRVNMIISKKMIPGSDHVYMTPEDAISSAEFLYPGKDIFIIGGQQLYDSTINLVNRFYVTSINHQYNCDRFFEIQKIKDKFNTEIIHKVIESIDNIPSYTIKEYRN